MYFSTPLCSEPLYWDPYSVYISMPPVLRPPVLTLLFYVFWYAPCAETPYAGTPCAETPCAEAPCADTPILCILICSLCYTSCGDTPILCMVVCPLCWDPLWWHPYSMYFSMRPVLRPPVLTLVFYVFWYTPYAETLCADAPILCIFKMPPWVDTPMVTSLFYVF